MLLAKSVCVFLVNVFLVCIALTFLLSTFTPVILANASQRDEGGSVFSFANQNGLDAQLPPTVVEFDDTLGALWKQLRL